MYYYLFWYEVFFKENHEQSSGAICSWSYQKGAFIFLTSLMTCFIFEDTHDVDQCCKTIFSFVTFPSALSHLLSSQLSLYPPPLIRMHFTIKQQLFSFFPSFPVFLGLMSTELESCLPLSYSGHYQMVSHSVEFISFLALFLRILV